MLTKGKAHKVDKGQGHLLEPIGTGAPGCAPPCRGRRFESFRLRRSRRVVVRGLPFVLGVTLMDSSSITHNALL